MEEAFEEGQGPHRAVEPVMMMINTLILFFLGHQVLDNPAKKLPAQAVQGVKQFINAVQNYTSHYSRMQNPHKKYFDHDTMVTSL
jgi:hypothetical protein